MSYQTYSLTRVIDGGHTEFATSFTTSDDDAINCAHMLAAGFNTMSRNFMGDFVLAVVDTKARTVQFDGKIEKLDSKTVDPWSAYSQSFTFEPSAEDADTILTLFGNGGTPTFTAAGKFTFAEESKHAHVNRDVLEAAYGELEDVKSVLFDAGVETIPADAGVRELVRRTEFELHARTAMEQQHARANDAARAEMIEYVKKAHAKLKRVDAEGKREDMQGRFRGMLDVLAKFLVVTGEADYDERHAVARRVCEIGDE